MSTSRSRNPPTIHDLVRLAALVTAAVGRSEINADELERINQYYTLSRYPQAFEVDSTEEPSAPELTSMVSTGRKILDQARQLVERTPAPESGSDTDIDDRADNASGGTDHTT